MFPTKEEALEIAKKVMPIGSEIYQITDDETQFKNIYNFPQGCWYITYNPDKYMQGFHSSYFIAISKVDGRIIMHNLLNDEG